ncbi:MULTISPECIES: TlpA disulfide reductase family protein [Anaeromyxobacter]|uniref:TlpA disulfide reductase family protein n=1 Tax=Anaeromyxobacter TaxID=161492 RepID=UPI001F5778C6|nr:MULTISPECIES: TlpA disulfide reductase family protein [unclassified Anaeromyxobacter]
MSSPDPAASRLAGAYRRLRGTRAARWAVDLAFVLAAVLLVGAWQTRGHLERGTAPSIVLPSLTGERVALDSLRGKPVLVAFWAPWCPVCKAASGNLSWVSRLAGARARVVTIAAAYEDLADVRAYVREQGVELPVLLADDGALRAFRVDSFPTYYFLDAQGRVKRSAAGYTTTVGMLLRLLL